MGLFDRLLGKKKKPTSSTPKKNANSRKKKLKGRAPTKASSKPHKKKVAAKKPRKQVVAKKTVRKRATPAKVAKRKKRVPKVTKRITRGSVKKTEKVKKGSKGKKGTKKRTSSKVKGTKRKVQKVVSTRKVTAKRGKKTVVKKKKIQKGKSKTQQKLSKKDNVAKSVKKKNRKLVEKRVAKKNGTMKKSGKTDFSALTQAIEKDLHKGKINESQAEIQKQRVAVSEIPKDRKRKKRGKGQENFVATGITGFDQLFSRGIPKGNAVIVAGGAGSGKTIFCLQTLYNHAKQGHKCLYMSFEESEERLLKHMRDFGWDDKKALRNLKIQRFSPFDITRSVDALLMKAKGELLIDIEPVIFPKRFTPMFIALDSLTAVASAFTGKEDSYRIYIEQLFRFFEKSGATTFLITETAQIPKMFSTTGVEEFLADGVVVLYAIKQGNVRENAIEVLKMRGERHEKKIVAMQIHDSGIEVYPEQEVFSGLNGD